MAGQTVASLRSATVDAHKAGRHADALTGYTRYLAQRPDDAGIWTNLGALFRTMGQHEMGRIAQKRAFALAPDDLGVMNNYANILSDLGDYEHSIALRKMSLERDPSHVMHHAMIGRCLRGMGDYDAAMNYLGPMVERFPQEPEIALQLAFAQLAAGRYGQGFRTYDARWATDDLAPPKVPFSKWQDGMSIKGKTVLIFPEQGFGDMILMARFIPRVAAMGAKIRLVAKKPLMRLLENVEGIDWIGSAAKKGDPVDLWISLMDLPKLVFGADVDGMVPPPVVLSLPEDAVTRAKSLTRPHNGSFKVGVVWSGSATYKGNTFRSFSHREFLPMAAIPNVQLFSLYKGPFLDAFQNDGSAAIIVDAAGTDRDFADCAATMQEMDLIITSDTATAHIAGSLGVPVWVMLHWDAFWVYRHKGETTQWYPSMRLFRQSEPLNWASAFDAAHDALTQELASRG